MAYNTNSAHKQGVAIQVRLSGKQLDDLENWRRAQKKIPTCAEALREALRRLVANTPPNAARAK